MNSDVIVIDGIKVSKKTNFPVGRPPKDPAKRAVYDKLRKEAIMAKAEGVQIVYEEDDTPEPSTDGTGPVPPQDYDLTHQPPPPPEPERSDEEILADTEELFGMMVDACHEACQGSLRSLIVSSRGGMGKTVQATEVVEWYVENEEVQADIISGSISPVDLYMLLYNFREKNCVIVLDDADNIFWNDEGLNIMKAAMDTTSKRRIHWQKQSNALKADDIPQSFVYEGSLIFLTNIDFEAWVTEGRGKLVPHLQAMMTRAMYLDLKLHREREVKVWIRHIVPTKGICTKLGLTEEQQNEILDFIDANFGKLREPSLRTAVKLAQRMKAHPLDWHKWAEKTEFRKGFTLDK